LLLIRCVPAIFLGEDGRWVLRKVAAHLAR
jgi:hypothetical protein